MNSNQNFCSFFREGGKVVYKNTNMISGKYDSPITNILDGELINHDEVYINKDHKIFYHKSYNLTMSDSPLNNNYLEWKETRKKDWDWFATDVKEEDLLCIKDVFKDELSNHSDIDNKIKLIKMKTEIMTNTFIISKKFSMNTEDTLILTKLIEATIDVFTLNKFE